MRVLSLILTLLLYDGCAAIENCPMDALRAIIERAIDATLATQRHPSTTPPPSSSASNGIGEEDSDVAPLQMQVIRRILEDVFGGQWGVLIVKDASLVSTRVHWTFPDVRRPAAATVTATSEAEEVSEAPQPQFCLHVSPANGWQYNVFRAANVDAPHRLSVEEVVERVRKKQLPERFSSLSEFDRRVTDAFRQRQIQRQQQQQQHRRRLQH